MCASAVRAVGSSTVLLLVCLAIRGIVAEEVPPNSDPAVADTSANVLSDAAISSTEQPLVYGSSSAAAASAIQDGTPRIAPSYSYASVLPTGQQVVQQPTLPAAAEEPTGADAHPVLVVLLACGGTICAFCILGCACVKCCCGEVAEVAGGAGEEGVPLIAGMGLHMLPMFAMAGARYYMAHGKPTGASAAKGADAELGEIKAAGDAPGLYIVKHTCSVQPTLAPGGSDDVIELPVGKEVTVLEVVTLAKLKRVRARIEKPSGWISLRNTESGHRWAVKI